MSNPMLTPHDKWQSFKCGCVYQHGIQIHGACEGMCHIPSGYLAGRKEPNYPVPALRLEVETDLEGVAILHWPNNHDWICVFEYYPSDYQ